MSGKWDEAIRLLEDYYGQSAEDNSDRARMEYLLAELYLGNRILCRQGIILFWLH